MHILIIVFIILLVIFVPAWWAKYTFRQYSKPRKDIPGNGGQFARHLLDQLSLESVKVEETKEGQDHYDPTDKVVRLGKSNFNNNSLTAMTVAAHEVGHAIQDRNQETKLIARTRMIQFAAVFQKLGAALFIIIPIVTVISRSHVLGVAMLVAGVVSMFMAVLVHFVTLPVEFDASFNKALPILVKGKYLDEPDIPAARRILKAAAMTYVAASLMSILNLARWIAILRR